MVEFPQIFLKKKISEGYFDLLETTLYYRLYSEACSPTGTGHRQVFLWDPGGAASSEWGKGRLFTSECFSAVAKVRTFCFPQPAPYTIACKLKQYQFKPGGWAHFTKDSFQLRHLAREIYQR